MATTLEISEQVELLAAAYGRRVDDDGRIFEPYEVALADIDVDHLRRGVTTLLRERLQFMPTPAEVRAHANHERSLVRRSSQVDESERRLVCAVCQDRGVLRIVNRHWLAENRDRFTPEWFVAGWMRQAELWSRVEGRGGLLQEVACECACYNATVFRSQRERFIEAKKSDGFDEKKHPRPAYGLVANLNRDCIVRGSAAKDMVPAILDWAEKDNAGRTWGGNWNPDREF